MESPCWIVANDMYNNTCTRRDWSPGIQQPSVHFPYPSLILYESVSFLYSFTVVFLVRTRFPAETRFKHGRELCRVREFCSPFSFFFRFSMQERRKKKNENVGVHYANVHYATKNEWSVSKREVYKNNVLLRERFEIEKKKKKKTKSAPTRANLS